MAINIQNEWRATLGVRWPVPDGTIDGQDRRQVLGIYPTLTSLPQGLRIAALSAFLPGAAAAQGFLSGPAAGQAFLPGAAAAQGT